MKMINEIGNRYGKWKVISKAESSKHKQCQWLCLCDCGTERIVIGINLRSGTSKSCGCSFKLANGVAARNHVVFQTRRSAKDRGYEFSISTRYLIHLHQKKCFYCGTKPSTRTKDSSANYNGNYTYNGIDRINNKKGYVFGNVVACCPKCNFMKGSMDSSEFIDQVFKIVNNI